MKLYTSWGNDTLKDLTKLVGLLGVFGNHLHLSKVEDGCIAVIWLCSISVAEDLKDAIPEVSDALQSKGVLQVFVGEEIVFQADSGGMWIMHKGCLGRCVV